MTHEKPDSTLRAGYAVGRLEHVLRRDLRSRLGDLGITLPAYTTLSVLRERPGLSNAQLARRAMVSPQAMNQLVAMLLEQRLIERESHPNHQRILKATLTQGGLELLGRCDVVVHDLEDQMLTGVGHKNRERLIALLRTCVRNLGAGL